MSRLSANLDSSEFACKCCGRVLVTEKLVQGMQKLRDKIGVPLIVTCGYRCPAHNAEVGGAVNSLHITGQAADVTCSLSLSRLYFEALGVPEFQTGGVGLYPENNFIHVDVRQNRARWGRVGGQYCSIHRALEALKKARL